MVVEDGRYSGEIEYYAYGETKAEAMQDPDEPLVVWHADENRPRISGEAPWRESLRR